MRFRRHAGAESRARSDRTVALTAADDANLPLLDVEGRGFELLRSLDLGLSLWRTSLRSELDGLDPRQIVMVAAYTPDEIVGAWPLMQRFTTIVLAVGLGPSHASRALTRGAIAYVDATNDQEDIRAVISDAMARVGSRRLRESGRLNSARPMGAAMVRASG